WEALPGTILPAKPPYRQFSPARICFCSRLCPTRPWQHSKKPQSPAVCRSCTTAPLTHPKKAQEPGRLPRARIDQAVTRVLRAKARVGLHQNRFVDLESLPKLLARREFIRAADEIGNRGVTLLRETKRILPLDATRPLKLLLVNIAGDPDAQA